MHLHTVVITSEVPSIVEQIAGLKNSTWVEVRDHPENSELSYLDFTGGWTLHESHAIHRVLGLGQTYIRVPEEPGMIYTKSYSGAFGDDFWGWAHLHLPGFRAIIEDLVAECVDPMSERGRLEITEWLAERGLELLLEPSTLAEPIREGVSATITLSPPTNAKGMVPAWVATY